MECEMGIAHVACNGVCVCVWYENHDEKRERACRSKLCQNLGGNHLTCLCKKMKILSTVLYDS